MGSLHHKVKSILQAILMSHLLVLSYDLKNDRIVLLYVNVPCIPHFDNFHQSFQDDAARKKKTDEPTPDTNPSGKKEPKQAGL